jgi:hypothetical protein
MKTKNYSNKDIEIYQHCYPYIDADIYVGPTPKGQEWKLHRCFVYDPKGHDGSKRKPFFYFGDVFMAKNSEDSFEEICSYDDKKFKKIVPLSVRRGFKEAIPRADKLMKKQLKVWLKKERKLETA